MKKLKNIGWALFAFTTLTLMSCSKDDDNDSNNDNNKKRGTLAVRFDNVVGSEDMQLDSAGHNHYHYTNSNGQTFGLSLFGYYVSKIRLTGPDGAVFEDEMNVSPNPDEVKGYYQVLESETSSQIISLQNIPTGTYDNISFIIGVEEDGVQEGAAGGVLDPANGAWFWNWNAGYIGIAMEGNAPDSPQEFVDWGGGFVTHANTFAIHVGGWKDLPADSNGVQNFVNNIRTIDLDFTSPLKVEEGLNPRLHLKVDALEWMKASNLDFATTYSVHSPGAGKAFADQMNRIFSVDHVHQ